MTIHKALTNAGIDVDYYESDLYVQITPESFAIISDYPQHFRSMSLFLNRTDDKLWFDIPCAYDPYYSQ